jgi:predicted MFS family arabinose efflux permease
MVSAGLVAGSIGSAVGGVISDASSPRLLFVLSAGTLLLTASWLAHHRHPLQPDPGRDGR